MTLTRNFILGTLALALAACNVPNLTPTPTPTEAQPLETSVPAVAASRTAPVPTQASSIVRIQSGEQALFYGDYDSARTEFESAYNSGDSPEIKAAALWGLARVEYADGRYEAALETLNRLNVEFPESAFRAYSHFLIGETQMQLQHYTEAVGAYEVYQELRSGILDTYVQEQIGDAFSESGDFAKALSAYERALEAPSTEEPLNLRIKAAQMRTEIGDYAGALSIYDAIFTETDNDYIKAQMDYLAGVAHQATGQDEQATARFQHAVENYPLSVYAYLSLVELVANEIPVSDLDRGLVDYFAGQYSVALLAFDRYITDGMDTDGTAQYYRALTQKELGNLEAALNGLKDFITKFPEHPRWAEAWWELADIYWLDLKDNKQAAETMLGFVSAHPTHPRAAEALMRAGRIYEYDGFLEQAAQTWIRVADEYPSSLEAPEALHMAGIIQYRRGDYHQALPLIQRSLLLSTEPADQARAYLWIGKIQEKLGDDNAKQTAWGQAQFIDPKGYYSERARDLLNGNPPFAEPMLYNLEVDLATERKDAASWVRIRFELPADTDLNTSETLANDLRFIRGTEFWELGMYEQARFEFESLRESVSNDPGDSFRLANYMLDLGLYRSAIFAARQVLTLAGLDEHYVSLNAPAYFNHVRYGLYYQELIVPAAEEFNLHPLFLFSVARQESLFEGFVHSTAGARGIMQIIPTTGANLAQTLRWPRLYEDDDLYRPYVSVRLGAYYLDSSRDLFDGDMYAALAAYNAGPGNASIWKELAGDDPDLFLEVIRFRETQDYIRYIYEIYNTYKAIYSPTE